MAPRGVAIPDLRERLFGAAEQVLAREGPAALTSRAITAEAGCAKGLLHAHFDGLDEFVAELVLNRFARTAHQVGELPGQAGHATVADNLATATFALLNSLDPTVIGLAMTRPAAALRIRQALEAGAPSFTAVQDAFCAYLDAEQRLGRLPDGTDSVSIALALVGTVHHLLMTSWATAPDPREQMKRVIALLVDAGPGSTAATENAPRTARIAETEAEAERRALRPRWQQRRKRRMRCKQRRRHRRSRRSHTVAPHRTRRTGPVPVQSGNGFVHFKPSLDSIS